jgi:hypothetical protein
MTPESKGSVASGESAVDVMTGQPLRFEVVSGQEAVKDPLMKGENASENYIKVLWSRNSSSLPCSQDEFFYHSVLQKHTDKEFNMN